MGYHPEKHSRRSTRLKGYDYASPGWYFVTICTHNRACLFGQINDGKMTLNEWGRIARDQWRKTESIRDNVLLDAFVIMPNHMHGIVQITGSNNNTGADSAGTDNVVGAYHDTPLRDDTPCETIHPPIRIPVPIQHIGGHRTGIQIGGNHQNQQEK